MHLPRYCGSTLVFPLTPFASGFSGVMTVSVRSITGAGVEYKLSDEVALIGGLRFMQSIIDVTDDSGRFLDGKKENSKGTINSMDIRIGVSF